MDYFELRANKIPQTQEKHFAYPHHPLTTEKKVYVSPFVGKSTFMKEISIKKGTYTRKTATTRDEIF